MEPIDILREALKKWLDDKVFIIKEKRGKIVSPYGSNEDWIFDFRAVLLEPEFLDLAATLFWETFKERGVFQIGGLESASLPLIAAIVLKGRGYGKKVHGFYIRKSRKPTGLQKVIEGGLTDDPIILIDDLINSGSTFLQQIEILKAENKKVSDIFVFVAFRDLAEYIFTKKEDIRISAVFEIQEFTVLNRIPRELSDSNAFEERWVYRGLEPNYFYRIPKSAPVIDETRVYCGGDDGVVRAFDQTTGIEQWNFKMYGFGDRGKTIFSTPAIDKGTLYFGAYDGNFYALDASTGRKKWVYMDADWIGSSPCVASERDFVYIGLEFGLWKKHGGIAALDTKTGAKKWEYIMPSLTHSSPAYSKKYGVVAIGSNNGIVYLFRASDGKLLWQLQTGGEIKASFGFDEKRGYLTFGSFDGKVYVVNVKNGNIMGTIDTGMAIYSTPLVADGFAYVSGLNKLIYCIDLASLQVVWTFQTSGRVFASPTIVGSRIYVGSNDGRLYELDAQTGKNIAFFQTTERITNKIAHNKDSDLFFIPTYANQIFCLRRKKGQNTYKSKKTL